MLQSPDWRAPRPPLGLLPTPLPSFLTTSLLPLLAMSRASCCVRTPFVDSSCCWGSRAEEEEGQPGQAGERQQEPRPQGEQGGGHRRSETQGPAAATARDSGAGHLCGAHLGTLFSLPVHAKESSAALCDESFTELEYWGQCVHTLSIHTGTHRHMHTDPMSKQVTDICANMCACMRACTHTHRGYWKTLLSLGHHCVSGVGRQRDHLCPSEGQEAHTWFVIQPVDASERMLTSVQAQTLQSGTFWRSS